jgi:nucleoside 2-deoxyribosyltransferase
MPHITERIALLRLYITATFKGTDNRAEIERLCALVARAGWEDFCFIRDVEGWQKVFESAHDLMQRSLAEIAACDALLIDLTHKPTGRAYEAGMAYALGKRIILIMRRGTPLKDTSRGIADAVIEYDTIEDIVEPLVSLLQQWTQAVTRTGAD